MSSTPTLFNAGTRRSQLSSCYLTTVSDDLDGIYEALKENALLSKFAGGLGNDWTNVRALGSHIKGTNGKSQGVVPFLKVVNDTAVAVNQGGKRKGAVCAYLETWHLDIEEFLELRKNTGDDRRRTHDMNTANWVPDLFMKRVMEGGDWTLFSPSTCPDLHDKFGKAFEDGLHRLRGQGGARRDQALQDDEGERPLAQDAVDAVRDRASVDHVQGRLQRALAAAARRRRPLEQPLHRDHAEHRRDRDRGLQPRLGQPGPSPRRRRARPGQAEAARSRPRCGCSTTSSTSTTTRSRRRATPTCAIARSASASWASRTRSTKLGVPYASEAAVDFADRSMEAVCYHAYWASTELAAERGRYSSYRGSLWDRGILPIDSLDLLAEQRGGYVELDRSTTLDWDALRERIAEHGMRNSNCVAIAPTATISNIVGVSASIEPSFGNLSVKSNLSGEFTIVNEYLVRDLKKLGLWDDVMVMDLKHFDGSLRRIDRVPEDLKALYATAFEIETQWLVEAAARRQKWIDQAQSLNIYMAGASGKKLDETYKLAWLRGLKTTYYLRTVGATHAEKSTVKSGQLNAVASGSAAGARRSRACRGRADGDVDGAAGRRDRRQVLRDRRPRLRSMSVSPMRRSPPLAKRAAMRARARKAVARQQQEVRANVNKCLGFPRNTLIIRTHRKSTNAGLGRRRKTRESSHREPHAEHEFRGTPRVLVAAPRGRVRIGRAGAHAVPGE